MPQFLKIALFFGLVPLAVHADTITFDTFPGGAAIPDSTPITNQFPGLTFTNTTVISEFISLNEGEFPPFSTPNVAFDDGGPITIDFATPIADFSGHFTYAEELTMDAFGVGNVFLASATSQFSNNELVSGDAGSAPNELIDVSSTRGITSVTITADPDGGSFTMDNITFNPAAATVPEPGAFTLLAFGLALMAGALRRRRLLLAGIGAVVFSAGNLGAQTVGTPEITPKFAVANQATDLTVFVRITGNVIPSTVILQEVDASGKIITPNLATMMDNGAAPDLKSGDGVFSVTIPSLTLQPAKPRYFRVSAGFKGMLMRVACGTVPFSPVKSFVTTLTPDGIQTYLNDNKATVNSTAAFLQVLDPAQFKKDWIMMSDTLSSQEGDAVHPRFILQNPASTAVFGVAQSGEDQDLIEYIQWVAAEKKFHFHSINTTTGMVTPDNPACTSCHSGPDKDNAKATWPYPRPNWDAYDSWGGALPYNRDRIYVNATAPTVEQKAIQRLLKDLAPDPVVSQLDLPAGITRDCNDNVTIMPDPVIDGAPATIGVDAGIANPPEPTYDEAADGTVTYPGMLSLAVTQGGKYLVMHSTKDGLTSDQGRGVALFDNFTPFNALRVAQELADKWTKETDAKGNQIQVVDIRPVALAIAGGGSDAPCTFDLTDLTPWAPQKALDALLKFEGVKSFQDLYTDTFTRQHSLPQIKADLEAANVFALMKANGDNPDGEVITEEVARRSLYGPPSQGADFNPDTVTKFMIDREIYGDADPTMASNPTLQLALFRFFLEASKVPVNKWSMSLFSTNSGVDHSATYTFGDLFSNNYPGQIVSVLGDATLGDGLKGSATSCAQLMKLSNDSFTAAINNNPGYFQ